MRRYQRPRPVKRVPPSTLRSALRYAIWASLGAAAAASAQETPAAPPAAPDQPAAQQSSASDPAPVTLDEVVVTGIRGSIQSSIERKREESVVSDGISAEDIGDLPALSIGEAIETITGASTHREKGGATEISIRGLGPFLGSASFNGREATNGSGDRSVNFNQFPSELINTVNIYKTQRADFVEGGIAGTVNMETIKPLDFGKRRIQLEARGVYADYDSKLKDGDGAGWRGTASYLDQFDLGGAGQLGVSVGVQSLRGTNPEEVLASSSTWTACDGSRTVTNNNCPELSKAAINDNGTPFYLIPNSRTYRQIVEHDERDAAFVALQWRPNEAWDISLDYQNSQRTFTEDRSELNFADGRRAIANRVVDDAGALLGYNGSSALESTSNYKVRDEEYEGGGLTVQWRPNEAWLFSTDLSYSHTLRTETDLNTRLRSDDTDIYGNRVAGITGARYVDYRYDHIGDVPSIVVNPLFDLNDHDNFSDAARTRSDLLQREHEIRAARFDGAFFPESGLLTAVKAGVRLSDASYADLDERLEVNVGNRAAIRDANLACRQDFPQDDFLDSASGNTIDHWATFDSRCLFGAINGPGAYTSVSNDVEEKTQSVYLMGDFSSELFGLPVTGNLGVRWVKTDVRSVDLRPELAVNENPSDGSVQLNETGVFSTQTIKASHDVLLPSLNASFELNSDTALRFGLYRAMARPDMSALSAGRTFDTDVGFESLDEALRSVTASGNPRAKPLMAWNADVSLEWYPNPDTMLAAAIYYKQFTGGSVPTVIDEEFVIDGQTYVVPVEQDTTTDDKSDLVGLELTATHRFSYLPAPFDGLGFKTSYNYADSNFETHDLRLGDEIDPETGEIEPGIVEPAGIFGLSKHVFSGSLYWTLGPVELQTIYKYRSEYYQKFVGAPSQNRYVHGNSTVDFRATWRASENLSFSLEASNLTDEPKISDMPISGSFHEYHAYGRRYYLGVRYRF